MAKAKVDALSRLDGVAQKAPKKKKSDIPELVVDTTLVDKWCGLKEEYKRVETAMKEAEGNILIAVNNARWDMPFSKSFRMPGTDASIRCTFQDSYSISASEEDVRSIIGNQNFDNAFTTKRIVKVKDEVIADSNTLDKLLSKFSDEEIAQFFTVDKKVVAKDDLDKTLHANDILRKKLDGLVLQKKMLVLEK